MTTYTAKQTAPAQWDVLRGGEPCGLKIWRLNNSLTRWEWAVVDREGCIQASVFRGGVKAAIEHLELLAQNHSETTNWL